MRGGGAWRELCVCPLIWGARSTLERSSVGVFGRRVGCTTYLRWRPSGFCAPVHTGWVAAGWLACGSGSAHLVGSSARAAFVWPAVLACCWAGGGWRVAGPPGGVHLCARPFDSEKRRLWQFQPRCSLEGMVGRELGHSGLLATRSLSFLCSMARLWRLLGGCGLRAAVRTSSSFHTSPDPRRIGGHQERPPERRLAFFVASGEGGCEGFGRTRSDFQTVFVGSDCSARPTTHYK